MKKIFSVFLLITLMSFSNTTYIFAEDSTKNNTDDGTLDLDTEDIKNKQESSSSLTDLNGLNLFTNDLKIILEYKNKSETNEYKKEKDNLFINKTKKNNNTKDEKDMIFRNLGSFDNTIISRQTEISVAPFFIVGTVFLGMLVFVLTRRKYKIKESDEIENNNNLYE